MGQLTSGGGVNGGHETLDDTEVVVDDLGQGGETVGGAAGVGDDLHGWVISVLIDTHHEHGGVGGGSRHHDLLGSALCIKTIQV